LIQLVILDRLAFSQQNTFKRGEILFSYDFLDVLDSELNIMNKKRRQSNYQGKKKSCYFI